MDEAKRELLEDVHTAEEILGFGGPLEGSLFKSQGLGFRVFRVLGFRFLGFRAFYNFMGLGFKV